MEKKFKENIWKRKGKDIFGEGKIFCLLKNRGKEKEREKNIGRRKMEMEKEENIWNREIFF